MKRTMAVAAMSASLLLAACGGGGGGSNDGTSTVTTTDELAKYAGTYTSACDGHTTNTATVTRTATNALTIALREDVFQEGGCTGGIVGTATWSTFITITYTSTSAAAVVGYPTANSITNLQVDRVTVLPAGTVPNLTGAGLQVINGELCIAYTNGNTCPQGAAGPASPGGMVLTGSTMLILSATNAGYELDEVYTRQ